MQPIHFLKTALTDFRVGAVRQSSKYVVRAALCCLKTPRVVVEYGSGDGVMTREILKCLPPDGRLLAVEPNDTFAAILCRIADPRLRVVEENAQNVAARLTQYGFARPDIIISSLPFSLLTRVEREAIVFNAWRDLATGGRFIIFHQYTPLVAPLIKKYFGVARVSFEPRNILPCFIICAEKKNI